MKILVTGGAGYKGSVLTRMLLEKGHRVIVIDRFLFGYDSLLDIVSHPALEVINKDVRVLSEADLKNYDVIFHLAGLVGFPACQKNPSDALTVNVEASQKIVKSIGADQVFIYASTTSLYGKSIHCCDENTEIMPISLYAKTKYEAEQRVLNHPNSVSLRFATVFGVSPRMRTTLLVNDFVYKAVNDKHIVLFDPGSRRAFIHIKDAIRAYLFAIENIDKMKGSIFNIGNEKLTFSKEEIAEKINEQIPCEIIKSGLEDPDQRNFDISFKKIEQLGFYNQFSLEDGVRELIKLYSYYKREAQY